MTSGLQALDELNLDTLDENGRPPKPSRLPDAKSLRALYSSLIRDDEQRAINRSRIQAMVDGEPPFNHAALTAAGQGSRANANFLEGKKLIQQTCNGYNDIVTSQKMLVKVSTEFGEPAQRAKVDRVISEEVTRTIRKWPSFMPNFMRLADLFVTHGVGVAFFSDDRDFRFDVTGLGEFLVPQQTPAAEDRITYAISRKDTMVTELYHAIEDPEVAARIGWNVEEVRKAIGRATTQGSIGQIGEIESWQQQVKNNDLFTARKFSHVSCLHGWIKEFDGTITYVIAERDGDGNFLFKQPSKYKTIEEAFVFFCYGVGNGTYHSIRGMGNMIYALVQLRNRMMCQAIDNLQLATSVLLETESNKAMEEATLMQLGPFTLLPPGFATVNRAATPDVSRVALPMLGEIKSMMNDNASRFMTPVGGGTAYQNKDSVGAELESAAAGDSGAIDLFYASLDRLFREMVRRMLSSSAPKTDPLIKELHSRLTAKGITREMIASVDHDSTFASRAIGAGNPAARLLTFERLLRLLPNLNEVGQKRLIYQFVSDAVGSANADYYADDPETPTVPEQAKIAELENALLMQGTPVTVNPQEMHATHVQVHIPPLMQTLDGIETGQLDAMQLLPGLQASLDHIATHGEALAADPAQRAVYGQVKEAVNNLQQVVTNMDRKIKAEQRRAQEGQAMPAEGEMQAAPQGGDRLAELKIAQEEFKLQLAQRIGELKIAELQSKAQQNLALADLKAADMVQRQLAFPRTTYEQRR